MTAMRSASTALLLLLGACASIPPAPTPLELHWSEPVKRVVLIEPFFELTEGLSAQPRDDWTKTGKEQLAKQLATRLANKNATLVVADEVVEPHETQLIKLHATITNTSQRCGAGFDRLVKSIDVRPVVLDSLHSNTRALESDNPETSPGLLLTAPWLRVLGQKPDEPSLGLGANALRQHYGADYALFVYASDNHDTVPSGAAKGAVIAAAVPLALLAFANGANFGLPSPPATLCASLVDLRTGDIFWWKALFNGVGGFLTEEQTRGTLEELLMDSPL